MPQSVFNRYEKKYLMPERVYQELRGRLSPYMQVDSYGLHTIVHFDDVAINRHLSEIRAHVACTKLRHLALYEFLFLFGDAELNSYWSCSVCHKNTPFNLQRTFFSSLGVLPAIFLVFPFTLQRTFLCHFRGYATY